MSTLKWEDDSILVRDTCECGHLAPGRMGHEPDEIAARDTPGPHHTPIRCTLYQRDMVTPGRKEGLVFIMPGPIARPRA